MRLRIMRNDGKSSKNAKLRADGKIMSINKGYTNIER